MNKKVWEAPEVLNIGINETEAGGRYVTTHDGYIYNDKDTGLPAEQYKS